MKGSLGSLKKIDPLGRLGYPDLSIPETFQLALPLAFRKGSTQGSASDFSAGSLLSSLPKLDFKNWFGKNHVRGKPKCPIDPSAVLLSRVAPIGREPPNRNPTGTTEICPLVGKEAPEVPHRK